MSLQQEIGNIHNSSEGNLLTSLSDGEDTTTPSPMTATFYFFILSIFYIIISTILIYTSVTSSSTELALNLIFVLLLVLGLYFINVETIKKLCGKNDDNYSVPYTKVATTTFVPWIIVFGSLFFLLELFPGWIRPFSNTVGYGIINALGAEKEFTNYLNDTSGKDKSGKSVKKNPDLVTAINYVKSNKSMFINEFSPNEKEFEKEFDQLKNSEVIMDGEALLKKGLNIQDFEKILYKFVLIKNTIGKGVWYILGGTVVSAISYNILLDINCQKSTSKMQSDINNLYAEPDSLTGHKWRLLIPVIQDDNGTNKLLTDTITDENTQMSFNTYAVIHGKPSNFQYTPVVTTSKVTNASAFLQRFDRFGNQSEPRGIPVLGPNSAGNINWGGNVVLNDRDMMIYGVDDNGFQEGNYIKVSPSAETPAITYDGMVISHLYYEVIE
jgi:hypothetical protein